MQGKFLYEYAIIRFLPKVERDEFLNIGVIMHCKQQGFLEMKYRLNQQRISCFSAEVDLVELENSMASINKICLGEKDGGAMALEDKTARFRWLTAVRSAVIQTSRPHQGFSSNLNKTLQCLFEDYVL